MITTKMLPRRKFFRFIKIAIIFGFLTLTFETLRNIENHAGNLDPNQQVYELEDPEKLPPIISNLPPYYDKYYKLIAERGVSGLNEPGQGGKPVTLSGDEKIRGEESYMKTAVNLVASEKIPVWRTVGDYRLPICRNITYGELPTASAIIIFHNEEKSLLHRTIHSIVNRSPPTYLKEVLIIDDASDTTARPYLGLELDQYIKEQWPEPEGFVRLIRQSNRLGLIRTRSHGIREAKGDVVVVLDSHCEVADGWLEPLLSRIKEKRTAIVTPEMDPISAVHLAYVGKMGEYWPWAFTGSFKWDLRFEWIRIKKKRDMNDIKPVRSPTMVGCVFAMRKDYFLELGGYDEGMDIWGGENIELPFRAWMCGGSLEIIPCSKAGHIWKAFHTYSTTGDTMSINSKRLAEVWMDDYKEHFYQFITQMKDYKLPDNIQIQHQLRQKLKCKSFEWFLENVIPYKFILKKHAIIYGQIRNAESGLCLTKVNYGLFGFKSCSPEKDFTQMFAYAKDKRIRTEYTCLSAQGNEGENIGNVDCAVEQKEMEWAHPLDGGEIKHVVSGKCIEAKHADAKSPILLKTCTAENGQTWKFLERKDILALDLGD